MREKGLRTNENLKKSGRVMRFTWTETQAYEGMGGRGG